MSSVRPLTKRQREIYDFLVLRIRSLGYAPSFEEIAKQFGFRSLSTVHEHLETLTFKGYIRRWHNEARSIELLTRSKHCEHCGSALPADPPHLEIGAFVDSYHATNGERQPG
jgi:repressor LexA